MTELDFVLDRSGSMAGPVSAGYGPAGFYVYASNFPYKKKNPNASPTWKIQFGYPYLEQGKGVEPFLVQIHPPLTFSDYFAQLI